MSFQWSQQAPAFEFPTCYRTENRFLTLRAALLFLLALVVFWVALAGPDPGAPAVTLTKIERGSSEPHVLLGLLLLVLGGIDLWVASRQGRLLLAPGQPASITHELMRMSKGVSTGAPWLKQVLSSGTVPAPTLRAPYRRALLAVAPQMGSAPTALQTYLGLRIAHFIFAAGLLVALGLTWAVSQAASLALAALFYSVMATALVARGAWIAKRPPSPTVLVVTLGISALLGLAIGLFGGKLPGVWRLASLGLPAATTVLLVCLLVMEGLAILAARFPVDNLPAAKAPPSRVKADFATDADRMLEELERELHRYWAEGVPNRRFAWQTSPNAGKADDGRFLLSVLEESQPLLPADQRDGISPPPMGRMLWLLALGGVGLLMTLAGGLWWVRMAYALLQDASSGWTAAGPALVLLVGGGYACRIGHLLWSRIEVESTLLWAEVRRGKHAPEDDTSPASAGGDGQSVQLRLCVVQARSAFYSAGEHKVGSRTLIHLAGDEEAAQRSIDQLRAYTERAVQARPAVRAPAAPAPAVPPRSPSGASTAAPKFCPACGTPVLQGARFCQSCGAALRTN